jgi:hypothetical protein
MIKIQIDENEYLMPENWDEISLEKLMKLNLVQKIKLSNDIETTSNIINILSDIPSDIILDIPLEDFTQLAGLITWIDKLPTKKVDHIIIDDIKYIPVDLNKLTAGEFISLEVFNKESSENNLHLISAILIRPEVNGRIEKLKDIIDIQQRAVLFKEKLMVGDLWPVVDGFFVGATTSSLVNTQDFLDQPKNPSRLRIASS